MCFSAGLLLHILHANKSANDNTGWTVPFRHLLETEMKTSALRASLQCLDRVAEDLKKNISQAMREKEIVLAKYQKIQDFGKLAVSCDTGNIFLRFVLSSYNKHHLLTINMIKYTFITCPNEMNHMSANLILRKHCINIAWWFFGNVDFITKAHLMSSINWQCLFLIYITI